MRPHATKLTVTPEHFKLTIFIIYVWLHFSLITVRVDVVDINDNAPQFMFDVNTSRYTAEIFENSPAIIILELLATDEDSTSNGMITFVASGGESSNML